MSEPSSGNRYRTPALPRGARSVNSGPQPSAGHGAVVLVSMVLAAALIGFGPAVVGGGLLALLVLLLGCFALVIPVAVLVTLWAQVRAPVRVLLALAGLACGALLAFAVARIAPLVPLVLSA